MSTFKWALVACSMGLGLAACSGGDGAPAAGQSASQALSSSDSRPSAQPIAPEGHANKAEAYNKYVGAHNAVAGMFYGSVKGTDALLEAYQDQALGNGDAKVNKNIGPVLYLNTSMLGNMIRDLEAAQALPVGGDLQGLESAGQKVLATAKDLLKQGEDLGAYFTSKKFLDDGYAKAKADNAAFEAKWAQFNQDYDAFSAQLDLVERQERLVSIDAFVKEGKLREAASEKVFLEASDVLKLVATPEDLNNPDIVAKVDAHMQALDTSLTELKTQMDQNNDGESSNFKSTHDYFNQFSGNWREFKASKNVSKFNDMVENYNYAVRFN